MKDLYSQSRESCLPCINRKEEADRVLSKIYSSPRLEDKIEILVELMEKELKKEVKVKYSYVFTMKEIRIAFICGARLQALQQFVGISIIMYYSPTIIQMAGFKSNQVAMFLSMIVSGMNAAGTILGIYLIDVVGRKSLSLGSLSEYRGLCGGMSATVNWICSVIMSLNFLSVVDAIGLGESFMILLGICVIAVVFVIFLMLETKGLTFEEMSYIWKERGYGKDKDKDKNTQSLAEKAALSSASSLLIDLEAESE
ncbi:Inositol transporter 1, partial [Mucuna pruriens]